MKNVLITGGSGMIGSEIIRQLGALGYQTAILTRNVKLNSNSFKWDIEKNYIEDEAIKWADIIINLAGTSVASGRWSRKRKLEISNSRKLGTQLIWDKIDHLDENIEYFVSASAVGYYDQKTDDLQKEDSKKGFGFLTEVVSDWEKSIFSQRDVPTAAIRIGVVLSGEGGALPKLMQPIKMGFGANLGSGNQMVQWIHNEDIASMFIHAIINRLVGVYNGVAGNIRHKELNVLLAARLDRSIWLPNIPEFLLKLALGEMSEIVLYGSPVDNSKIIKTNFEFRYPKIENAIVHLLPVT